MKIFIQMEDSFDVPLICGESVSVEFGPCPGTECCPRTCNPGLYCTGEGICEGNNYLLIYERGYFRSLGRGGNNSKNAFPFFSFGRTTMRQCALERSMSQVYQTIFFMSIDRFPASLHQLKVGKYR